MLFTEAQVDEVLRAWPRLRRVPSRDATIVTVLGVLDFTLVPPDLPAITDRYRIRLEVPLSNTRELPIVYEVGHRIPRTSENHVNPSGSLCLGSPLHIRLKMGASPHLLTYMEQCVVPFLYAASWRYQGNPGYPFHELAHGTQGLMDDYQLIFKVKSDTAVDAVLGQLSQRKRVANKSRCICGCQLRLGVCPYRIHLNKLRAIASRRFYRNVRRDLWNALARKQLAPEAKLS